MSAPILPKGGNTSLQAAVSANPALLVEMEWGGEPPKQSSVDVAALLLGENGKLLPGGFVFQLDESAAGSAVRRTALDVQLDDRRQGFQIDTARLPAEVQRVAFALVVRMGGHVRSLGRLNPVNICVKDHAGAELCRGKLAPCGDELALVAGEIYRRNNEWKFKLLGQAFLGGLRALAEAYGLTVAEAAQGVGEGEHGSAAATPGGTVYNPPVKGFGEITLTLNWSAAATAGLRLSPKGLGNLLSRKSSSADLDLCCLFELSDGHRGVVQALGDNLGGFNSAPYVELMGDSKEGAEGEVLRLNGVRWHELRRILVYAMVFEGAPNWAALEAKLTLRVPDEVPQSIRLTGEGRACAIALLENKGGKLVLHKLLENYNNPRELDEAHRWGLTWAAGRKG